MEAEIKKLRSENSDLKAQLSEMKSEYMKSLKRTMKRQIGFEHTLERAGKTLDRLVETVKEQQAEIEALSHR